MYELRTVYRVCAYAGLLALFVSVVATLPRGVVRADTATVTVDVVYFACNDGIDNDFDGLTDYPNDPGCEDASDDNEVDPQCLDGIDNDGDGLIDYPLDPGCSAPTDDDETNIIISPPGGGGGPFRLFPPSVFPPRARTVVFSGLAHPKSIVTLLVDGILRATTEAKGDATFSIVLSDVTVGRYTFSLYGVDDDRVRSGLLSFPMTIAPSFEFAISDIFIPPTISFASEADLSLFVGRTVPNSNVHIVIFGEPGVEVARADVQADATGRYAHKFAESLRLTKAIVVKSFAATSALTSPFGRAAGSLPSGSVPGAVFLRGDVNSDGRVNLVDFSIVAFWYKRENPPVRLDLNADGVVDLIDVSIMVFYWTG